MKHLPDITIDTVPHKKQRYDTAGDYFKKGGKVNIRVSKTCADHEFLIAMHELVEWYLIDRAGIPIEAIDAFDFKWNGEGEPGDDIKAPYHTQHQFATFVEMMLANKLGINWDKYIEHTSHI
jgi:hypothetical protein